MYNKLKFTVGAHCLALIMPRIKGIWKMVLPEVAYSSCSVVTLTCRQQ